MSKRKKSLLLRQSFQENEGDEQWCYEELRKNIDPWIDKQMDTEEELATYWGHEQANNYL